MRLRAISRAAFAATLIAALAACTQPAKRTPEALTIAPVAVNFAKAIRRDVPIEITAIGNAEAFDTVTVVPQVSGTLTKIYFHGGDYVKKGDKLFAIDRRQLKTTLDQDKAILHRDEAILSQDRAALARDSISEKYASAEAGRYTKLFAEGVTSKEQADQYRSSAETLAATVTSDRAAVSSMQAQIKADRAVVDGAKDTLDDTLIVSPIDGVAGDLTFPPGSVVTADATKLATIARIEPILAAFALPQKSIDALRTAQHELRVVAAAEDNPAKQQEGVVSFIDNNVDTGTATIELRATLPNSDHRFWPGEHLRVTLQLATRRNAVVVPAAAVQKGQNGQYVYVVGKNQRVSLQPVTTGAKLGGDVVIEQGLAAGTTVTVGDQLRLAPGIPVENASRTGI